jgi:hypothetical protein
LRISTGVSAGLAFNLIEKILEDSAIFLKADGGYVRQVIGDNLQIGILSAHAGSGYV